MDVFSTDGIRIGYDDTGRGAALVLVHGHPFDRSMWQPQIEPLRRAGWRLVVPDLRGYGQSGVLPGRTPLSAFARDIANLLDHLGLDRVVLAGLSMGGQIVLEFQRLFPDRTRALILADTSARAETDDGRRSRNELADRLLREGIAGYAEEMLGRMLTPANIRAHPDVAGKVLAMMRDTPAEGAAAALRGRAERPDYLPLLPRIPVPTLVVVGREDTFTPIAEARLIAEHIPAARLVVVDGAGHMPNLERPAEFNAAVLHFLASLPAAVEH